MLTHMAHWIVSYTSISDKDDQKRPVYEYGCEILLYTIFSTLGLVTIGYLHGNLTEAAIIIFCFYLFQSTGGGFHAQSHIACFLVMSIGLLLGLTLMKIASCFVILVISTISACILFLFPLHLHKNKEYLLAQSDQLIHRSRIVTMIIVLVAAIMLLIGQVQYSQASGISMLLAATSRLYAISQSTLKNGSA